MEVGDFAAVDIVIAAVIAVSALFGVLRGLVREVVSLAIWLAALLLGFLFAAPVGALVVGGLEPRVQAGIGFGAVFVVVLIGGALLQRLLGGLVESTGLTGTDRTLGLLFGAVRGVAVVLGVLIVLTRTLSLEAQPWWQESRLIPPLMALEDDVLDLFDHMVDWGGTVADDLVGEEPIGPGEGI